MSNAVLSPEQAEIVKAVIHADEQTNPTVLTTTKVTYQGEIMSLKDAHDRITEAQVASRNTFFDPMDLVEDIAEPAFRARVLSGMAWSVDVACINLARTMFYEMRSAKADSIDDFNEFINDIAELKANESYNEDLGFEENAGTLRKLSMLLVLRQQWHDRAETAAKVIGQKYAPKTLEEMIKAEKVRTVDGEALQNLELLATVVAKRRGKSDEEAKTIKEALVKQKNAEFDRQHKMRQLTAPAVQSIFAVAEYRSDLHEVQFHLLADDLRRSLVASTRRSVDRAINDLASARGVTPTAYANIVVDGYDLLDKLDAVLEAMAAAE